MEKQYNYLRSKTPLNRNMRERIKKRLRKEHSFSPSPFNLEQNHTEDQLKRELNFLKRKEKKLQKEKNKFVNLQNNNKKIIFRTESRIKTDSAKIQSEREKILLMLIELILAKKVKIDVPQGYQPSVNTMLSNVTSKYMKSSQKSKSKHQSIQIPIEKDQQDQLNQTIKNCLEDQINILPSSLRALMRGYNNQFIKKLFKSRIYVY